MGGGEYIYLLHFHNPQSLYPYFRGSIILPSVVIFLAQYSFAATYLVLALIGKYITYALHFYML